MARYTGPKCRYCRAEGTKLFLKGNRCLSGKCPLNSSGKRTGLPGKDPRARSKKPTNYGLQLREKQKLKRTYAMLEKQFKLTFNEAARIPGKTGENLIQLLEQRLDNVVFRLHFASSRYQAAQFVNHGHIFVNGKRVDIPSYRVKVGDEISISPRAQKMLIIKENLKEYTKSGVYQWLSLDVDAMKGTFLAVPRRSEVTELEKINEQLIVELYSR
ncbi:MAG: 30S ribosomal protein S4 [Spirochaetes bacterium ADurb.Bin315]|jgi:small subunit ribosomal protein S4|nr:30S ribosomal protein S4 [Spirochaetota bacterium]OQA43096.1 MAG: 30S ribosomal protein S4 [Spirochaetes bacterium ADurb.Bin315]TAH58502.1 MAG: 30S ribosomal protein S4 [Sphaerochaeta sp.]HOE88743.1 30S ribosomal protein S4 [Sphaerochaeta sp.]HOR79573.1 30S ribosomal protein S4 [Sphaerochaeta sp.]